MLLPRGPETSLWTPDASVYASAVADAPAAPAPPPLSAGFLPSGRAGAGGRGFSSAGLYIPPSGVV